jgi:protein-tyrosine phosphatase
VNGSKLPGQENLRRNALAGAKLLNSLRDDPELALRKSGYNQWLQGALTGQNMGGLESKIGGQVHADAIAHMSHAPQKLQQSLHAQLAQPASSGFEGPALWVNTLNDSLNHRGGNGIEDSKDSVSGLQAGWTQAYSDKLVVSGGLSQTKSKVRSSGDSAQIDLTYLSLGARFGLDSLDNGLYLGGEVGTGHVNYSSKRKLGALGTAKGESGGWMNNVAAYTGYRLKFDDWYVEPQAGLQATKLKLDSFHEKHSEVDLNMKGSDTTYTSALFDVKAGRSFEFEKWHVAPSVSMGYEHSLSGGVGESKASTNKGYGINQKSARQGDDLFNVGLSVDASFSDWTINTSVRGVSGNGTSGGSASSSITYKF